MTENLQIPRIRPRSRNERTTALNCAPWTLDNLALGQKMEAKFVPRGQFLGTRHAEATFLCKGSKRGQKAFGSIHSGFGFRTPFLGVQPGFKWGLNPLFWRRRFKIPLKKLVCVCVCWSACVLVVFCCADRPPDRPDCPPPDCPKFRSFCFLSCPICVLLSLLGSSRVLSFSFWRFLVDCGGVLVGRDPLMCACSPFGHTHRETHTNKKKTLYSPKGRTQDKPNLGASGRDHVVPKVEW